MSQICIHIPSPEVESTIELEVKVDGKSRFMNYRVESVNWTEHGFTHADRIDCLRQFINGYEDGWELVHIGNPDGPFVPIMFRQRL